MRRPPITSPTFGAAERDDLARAFGSVASRAGDAIMTIYRDGCAASRKQDGSPVTEADHAAEAILLPALRALMPGVPVISEEDVARKGAAPAASRPFILVDPLDGTVEFLKRNGEFTVNIALVAEGRPVVGIVYAPVRGTLYLGGARAWRIDLPPGLDVAQGSGARPLATRAYPAEGLTAGASRSHADPATEAYLAGFPIAARITCGSSLKFCDMAEGLIDIYPRFTRTMEWDTAAGQAIVEAAGGIVLTPEGGALAYGKHDAGFGNGPFVAWGRAPLKPRASLPWSLPGPAVVRS